MSSCLLKIYFFNYISVFFSVDEIWVGTEMNVIREDKETGQSSLAVDAQ